jgi:hypothetical protein
MELKDRVVSIKNPTFENQGMIKIFKILGIGCCCANVALPYISL